MAEELLANREGEPVADEARTFCSVKAKKFQKKHSVVSSLEGEEEDFLFGRLLGALGRAPISGGPSGGQHGGAAAGAGDRKQVWESGQDQIWRNSGASISAQAGIGLSVKAEHPPPTVVLGRAASASCGRWV